LDRVIHPVVGDERRDDLAFPHREVVIAAYVDSPTGRGDAVEGRARKGAGRMPMHEDSVPLGNHALDIEVKVGHCREERGEVVTSGGPPVEATHQRPVLDHILGIALHDAVRIVSIQTLKRSADDFTRRETLFGDRHGASPFLGLHRQ
jgi:hypothetical protein